MYFRDDLVNKLYECVRMLWIETEKQAMGGGDEREKPWSLCSSA